MQLNGGPPTAANVAGPDGAAIIPGIPAGAPPGTKPYADQEPAKSEAKAAGDEEDEDGAAKSAEAEGESDEDDFDDGAGPIRQRRWRPSYATA